MFKYCLRNVLRSQRRAARFYATEVRPKQSRSVDRSVLYPGLLLIILGSQIVSLINSQKKLEALERKYRLKIIKCKELTKRIQDGEVVDVEKELQLVNKKFQRDNDQTVPYKTLNTPLFDRNKQNQYYSTLGQKDIDLESDFDEETLNKLINLDLSLDDIKQGAEVNLSSLQQNDVGRSTITEEDLEQKSKQEQELLDYRLKPEKHVVVVNPGDYKEAAEDTKIKKFL